MARSSSDDRAVGYMACGIGTIDTCVTLQQVGHTVISTYYNQDKI